MSQRVLLFLANRLLDFSVFTAFLCCLGMVVDSGGSPSSFWTLLQTGTVFLWRNGVAQVFLIGIAGIVGLFLGSFWTRSQSLGDRRTTVTQGTAAPKAADDAGSATPNVQDRTLNDIEMRLAQLQKIEERIERNLKKIDQQEVALQEKEWKAQAWREELRAIRKKEEEAKERRINKNRHIRWALDALGGTPMNVGLAVRHLKKAEKL